ncbi:MAG TPA: VOC family protein [Thermomicrobiales bacterium]|jgi:catechol 2,3-dioxygenase|nr:VOC family protein [Thermomicrobiales bacterium]
MTSVNSASPPGDSAHLPSGLRLGPATLAVSDRERSLAFYRNFLGLAVLDESTGGDDQLVTLGTDDRSVLRLAVRPGVAPLPRDVTGLYHAAILLPDRPALGRIILRLAGTRYPFGASDHGVSEALYLDDPDGNGLEIYVDRPRHIWTWEGDRVAMTTLPLDLQAVVDTIPSDSPRWAPMPAGTSLGHMHLRVGNADEAERFYADVLGFDVVAAMPSARFMSVDRYHHHLGVNHWESAGGRPRTDATAGLVSWELVLPSATDLDSLADRLGASGHLVHRSSDGSLSIADPWGTVLVVRHV